MASDTDLAYLACMIDAEGSILMYDRTKKNGQHYLQCRIEVANSYLPTINWLTTNFGGTIHKQIPRVGKLAKKTTYYWYLGFKEAAPLLILVLPYLKEKRLRALVFLELYELETSRTAYHVSGEDLAKRQQLLIKLGDVPGSD